MMRIHVEILARHAETLRGRLLLSRLPSRALGIGKPYFVYEPADVDGDVPVVYLFRGHEREWVNIREDASRSRATSVERIDALIHRGVLPPMVVVMPGLSSADNRVASLGIDMAGVWPESVRGLGTGRFWQYLTGELIPEIDRRFGSGVRLAGGFSLGGYTAAQLAIGFPGYFDAVGIYDGLFMWPGHCDPREEGTAGEALADDSLCTDPIWCKSPLFDAALGRPRDAEAMHRWNSTDALLRADAPHLAEMRRTAFCIRCAAGDGSSGNRDRARYFGSLLEERGFDLLSRDVILDPKAAHTWRWTDRFLTRFVFGALARHSGGRTTLPIG